MNALHSGKVLPIVQIINRLEEYVKDVFALPKHLARHQ